MEVLFQANSIDLVIPFVRAEGKDDNNKAMVRRPIFFKGTSLRLDDEKEEDLPKIRRLREHMGNKANGGNSFWELDVETKAALAASNNEVFAAAPKDGVTESDQESLKYLAKLPSALPPPALKKALEHALLIYDRYNIVGIARPNDKMKQNILKATVTMMMDAIETRGIWNGENPARKEHSGESKAQD